MARLAAPSGRGTSCSASATGSRQPSSATRSGDVGAHMQTLLLAMTAYGEASCPQGLLSFYADEVRAELDGPVGKLLVGISFGYADDAAPVNHIDTGRAALRETTTFHD
ncbi:nitroreductase family protein [Streptomyces sp. NPDC059850]|uniref:nitroreductase family protein n=1 Tax=Streptomyces sp. NPDC059850 TaxID=3346970 RepID=UPI00365B8804